MTVYLLHLTPPLKHARHYIGFTKDENALRRSLEHKRGTKKGSPLIRAALAAGCTVKLAKTWPGADRAFERMLKNRKNASAFCPCCNSCNHIKIVYKPQEIKDEKQSDAAKENALRTGENVSGVPDLACDLPNNQKDHAE